MSALVTFFFGALLFLSAKGPSHVSTGRSARQGFAMIALSWSAAGFFSSLPFLLTIDSISITNAVFEAFSGITTTGSTVFTNLDSMDKSVLLWRSSLQWIGGIGFVVMAVIVLPALQIGGMQLFQIELFEGMEKDSPRISQIGKNIAILYLALTSLCSLSYFLAGMSFFDAINHAMTTVATGGYSTHDNSFAYFQSPSIEFIAVFFMIVGSLPFIILIHALKGQLYTLFRDEQIRLFFLLFLFFLFLLNIYLIFGTPQLEPSHAFRISLFNLTSIFTGTGYASAPFDSWGPTALAMFFFFMFLGGCAGSTSCGIKIFRFQVLGKILHNHIRGAIQPYGVFIAKYNGRPLTTPIIHSVMSFMACFLLFYIIIAVLLAAHGLDFLTALSATTAAIANVGPALGPIVGPSSTFQNIPESAKWILTAAMLLGRLDIITILVLFSPRFWSS
jgi:trk system potassium uptake protein TrkH